MKRIHYIFITLPLLLLTLPASAQVQGTVADRSGEPLPGVHVYWLETNVGATTQKDGHFSIPSSRNESRLVFSLMGYVNDTVLVDSKNNKLHIVLSEGIELKEVNVVGRKLGTLKLRSSVLNEDIISSEELSRAACCNLGESFTTNPSVDVSYSDAATGARQIKLLGLSGTYVQMMTENIPNFRGAASPYGLGYVPGPWMQSIQVSKGSSSVKNGYESIAGQINVEFKKPQLPEADWLAVNLFASSTERYEANADATLKLSSRWSTSLLGHYENETKAHDANHDGFADIPQVEQFHLWNRWAYMGDNYVFQAGLKALSEDRNSGQVNHGGGMPDSHEQYGIGIATDRYEFFTKNAFIFDKDRGTNLALILQGTWHDQKAMYGHKLYDVKESNAYASLLFETNLGTRHSFSTGLSFNYDGFDQQYRLTNDKQEAPTPDFAREAVYGGYAQYTLNLDNRWVLMAGLRGDHSSMYGFFVTPRAHVKFNPNEYVHFRLSAGKGYRSNQVLAENNYLLASSRVVNIAPFLEQEEAWNYGASMATYLPIFGKTMNFNVEYFYTDFRHQMVIDMDTDGHAVSFGNLDGRSYSQVLQAEASYPFFTGFTLTAAWRLTDVKTTIAGQLTEKPLTSKYKGLLTASYQTPLGFWQMDATFQLNGGGRMPTPYTLNGASSWEARYGSFEQLSAQVTRYFRNWSVYIGGENLTNFKQKNPIIDASNPWGENFDSTMIWGPVHGAKAYIGVRYNIPRF